MTAPNRPVSLLVLLVAKTAVIYHAHHFAWRSLQICYAVSSIAGLGSMVGLEPKVKSNQTVGSKEVAQTQSLALDK